MGTLNVAKELVLYYGISAGRKELNGGHRMKKLHGLFRKQSI